MFTDKQRQAWSAAKAPDELRERILASAEKENNNSVLLKTQFSRIVAAAACIVLVAVAVFAAFSGNGIEVSVNGSAVGENASIALAETQGGIALARSASEAEVKLTLDIDSDALITVDSGSFDVIGEGENLTEFSAEDNVEIIWRSNGMQKSEMTVDYGRKTCVLVLEYNGEWTVTRK